MAFLQENLPPVNDDQNESSDEEFERKINDPNALRKGIIDYDSSWFTYRL